MASYDTRGGYAGANIFQATDNIDKVLKQMAKLETKVQNELIKDSRKAMKDTVKSYRTVFRKITPKKTGALRKSVKLKSRSRRGITKVSLYWDSLQEKLYALLYLTNNFHFHRMHFDSNL